MRHGLWLALFGLLLLAPWGSSSPVQPQPPRMQDKALKLSGFSSYVSVILCKGGERTVAIAATTDQQVILALYVYDAHGNCVARDEVTERSLIGKDRRPATDDVAAEWYPPADLPYTIELRNQSRESCTLQMVVR
jgi:hypothetical protein